MTRCISRYLSWVMILLLPVSGAMAAAPRDLPKLSARAWMMMDINSGYVLSGHNEHLPLHPGDLTKLMSGYVLFRVFASGNIDLDQPVTIDNTVQATNGSRIFLQAGETVRTDKLLEAMFVHAANDATLSLARKYLGSDKQFVEHMNRQARVLGMTRSHFMNVTGLPDVKQASTAADLALLAQAITRHFPQYQDFFRTRKIRHHDINYYNRNAMLWRDAHASGLMASPNQATGFHLVATSKQDDQNLALVVLGAPNEQRLFEASQALLDYGRRAFETRLLYPANKVLAEIPVIGGSRSSVPVGTTENLYATLPKGSSDEMHARLDIEPKLAAPIELGQDAGNLTLSFGDEVIAEYPLVTLEAVPEGNALQKTWGEFNHWLQADEETPGAGNPDDSQQ